MKLSLMAFMIILSSCGGDNDGDSPRDGKVDPGRKNESSETTLINGVEASAYYKKFHYKEVQDENFPYYYVQSSYQHVGDETASDPKRVCAHFSLFLLDGGKLNGGEAVIDYEEKNCVWQSDDPSTQETLFSKRVGTTWKVDGSTLRLGEVAEAVGYNLNEQEVLGIKFLKNINREGLGRHRFEGFYGKAKEGL